MIRMADLAARHARVAGRAEAAVLEVLRSGRYVGGPRVSEVQARVSARMGWAHGASTNSGTDALVYAILALGLAPGGEIIVPAVTFFATAGAVVRAGHTPVVADVRPDYPNLDLERLPLRRSTRAVVAVHLYGEGCFLPGLDVPVVDDLAQVIGADPPPRNGNIGAMSFYPTKTLGAAGDGGLVLTDDADTQQAVLRLTHHGMLANNVHERVRGHVGANSRLDAMQAAVLLAHLDDLDARVRARRATAARYDAELPPWVQRLPRSAGHPIHQYVVRVPGRDALRAHLADRGVESAIYYPIPLSRQKALDGIEHAPTPEADRFCAESLALPVHECLDERDVSAVIDAVRSSAGGALSP
ncbi:MAG: DegT/DnrJ/EryC1/StrS family aminotransferase [Deltaproteobacteria bacterium]|nr:DegT/DnrJ/EryC1/StrS family aminotransferase [Deltaproteobacteria bacterium]